MAKNDFDKADIGKHFAFRGFSDMTQKQRDAAIAKSLRDGQELRQIIADYNHHINNLFKALTAQSDDLSTIGLEQYS